MHVAQDRATNGELRKHGLERTSELFLNLLHEPNWCVLLSKLGMQVAPRAMKRV